MENRNYVNSDYYEKLVREKIRRDSKVAKMQNKILSEQHQQQRSMCPKKPKKLAPEKLFKDERRFSNSDNDLLKEIDKSLNGAAKGFVFQKGN